MPEMIFFTDNYQDRGTREGYQFEFFCKRCGNGYTSSFQHSVTGFGGRMLRMGGDLIGGSVGEKASEIGWDAEWMRDGIRGSTRDRALAKAVEEMKPHFDQCHRCGQWVCGQVCPNCHAETGGGKFCASCGTPLAAAPAAAVKFCTNCGTALGQGRFCGECGTPAGG
jgi:Double zinc ribbon